MIFLWVILRGSTISGKVGAAPRPVELRTAPQTAEAHRGASHQWRGADPRRSGCRGPLYKTY